MTRSSEVDSSPSEVVEPTISDPFEQHVDRVSYGASMARLGLVAAMVSRVFGRLVGILLVVLLAREASPDTVAVYGYLLGTATLVATLTDLGVASIAGREVAAGRMPLGGALWAALLPQVVSTLAAAVAVLLLTIVFGPAAIPGSALALTVAFVVITGFVGLWSELLRASGRVVFEGVLQMASAVALVAGGVVVIALGGDATDLLLVVVGKELVVLVILVVLIRPRRDPAVRSRAMLGQSLWVAVAGTALIVLWRQGTIVAGTGSVAALAVYVVASRFLDAGVTIAHTAGFGLVPGMSVLANDPVAFRRSARRYVGLATLIGLVIAIVGAVAAHPLTVLPFGDRWADAVPAVRTFALSALPIMISFVAWPMLLARHQVRLLAVGCVAAVAVGLPTSIVLFERWGSASAPAIGTAVGSLALAVITVYGLRDVLFGSAPSASGVADDVE